MPTVTHLIQGHCPEACPAVMRAIATQVGADDAVVWVGDRPGYDHLRTAMGAVGPVGTAISNAGAGGDQARPRLPHWLRAAGSDPRLAWRGLRALSPTRAWHAWSVRGGRALTDLMRWRLLPRRAVRLSLLDTPPQPADRLWLDRSTSRFEAVTRWNPTDAASTIGHTPLPIDHEAHADHDTRHRLRERWGVATEFGGNLGANDKGGSGGGGSGGEASKGREAIVAVYLHDLPTAGAADALILAMGLVREALNDGKGPGGAGGIGGAGGAGGADRLVALVHPQARGRARAGRVLGPMGLMDRVIEESALADPPTVLPGCDLALLAQPGSTLAAAHTYAQTKAPPPSPP